MRKNQKFASTVSLSPSPIGYCGCVGGVLDVAENLDRSIVAMLQAKPVIVGSKATMDASAAELENVLREEAVALAG